jgi:DinB superfamily
MGNSDEVQKLEQEVRSIADNARSEFGKLSVEQLNWKPDVDRWSVAQCFDHLITANTSYFPVLESIINGHKKTSIMERVPMLPRLWGKLFIKSLDPKSTRKLKAPPVFQPSSSNISGSIIDDFAAMQSRLADSMEATKELDLERVIITSPAISLITYSLMDAYRFLVVHEQRHFQQAKRVTEDARFLS